MTVAASRDLFFAQRLGGTLGGTRTYVRLGFPRQLAQFSQFTLAIPGFIRREGAASLVPHSRIREHHFQLIAKRLLGYRDDGIPSSGSTPRLNGQRSQGEFPGTSVG